MTAELEASLQQPAPRVSIDEATDLATVYFGLRGTVEPLAGERGRNFKVREIGGSSWVLKVGHPAESAALSALSTAALLHVAEHDPDLPVPRIRRTVDRGTEVLWQARSADPAEPPSRVRLYSYLPGIPMHWVPAATRLRNELGRILARVDRALVGFDHPASRHDLIWDASRAPRVAELVDPTDTQVRDMLAHVEAHTLPRLPRVRHQVIHNDANPHNVMVDPAGRQVIGLIDFGDVIWAPLPQEVATASAYQLVDGADSLEACLDVLVGYHDVNPLTDEEADLVFDLMAARLVLIVVITAWRAKQHPRNRDYIMRNHQRARLGLERAAAIGCPAATTMIHRALEEQR